MNEQFPRDPHTNTGGYEGLLVPKQSALSTAAVPKRQTGRLGGMASLFAAMVISATAGAGLVSGLESLRQDDNTAAALPGSNSQLVPTSLVTGSVADIYEAVSPAVVKISTTARNGGGLGSGVVINGDGLILTNYHVVEGATTIEVSFSDGQTAIATVVETSEANDLALIDVDGINNIVVAEIGNSNALRSGDEVIAIGNPLGLANTVTVGVVSGLERELGGNRSSAGLSHLIQLDAAVNSGSSGGGLFNASGELVGVPTAIENPTGNAVFIGIAYAVPMSIALENLQTLATF